MGWIIAGAIAVVVGAGYVWSSKKSTFRRLNKGDGQTNQAIVDAQARSIRDQAGGAGFGL